MKLCLCVAVLLGVCALKPGLNAQDVQFDFALHKDFLKALRDAKTITPSFDLTMVGQNCQVSASLACSPSMHQLRRLPFRPDADMRFAGPRERG